MMVRCEIIRFLLKLRLGRIAHLGVINQGDDRPGMHLFHSGRQFASRTAAVAIKHPFLNRGQMIGAVADLPDNSSSNNRRK